VLRGLLEGQRAEGRDQGLVVRDQGVVALAAEKNSARLRQGGTAEAAVPT